MKLPTIHNRKRRARWHNYREIGTYLLTLAVEGRQHLLGRLIESPEPRVELTTLGRQINDREISKISQHYPNVEIWGQVIMPDHMHLIVHIKTPFAPDKHLGSVVHGFKVGCTRAYWALTSGTVPGGSPVTVPGGSPPGLRQVLFEKGYNDGILMSDPQLDAWKRYLKDNPRRLVIKRRHPDYFIVLHDMDICGKKCQIVGNRFLLDIPDRQAVIVHGSDTRAEFAEKRKRWLACGERGGVLIGAAISAWEKEVMHEAMERGYRIILLRENGFPKLYKPAGRAFDACAAGQLLQISPWPYHNEKHNITRAQCLYLNALAEALAR